MPGTGLPNSAMARGMRGHARPHFIRKDLSVVLEPIKPHEQESYVSSKVLVTLGPACQSVETLAAMLRAGMSIARVGA